MKKNKPTVEETGRDGELATFRAFVGETEVAHIVVHVPTRAVREMNETGPKFEFALLSKFSDLIERQLAGAAGGARP